MIANARQFLASTYSATALDQDYNIIWARSGRDALSAFVLAGVPSEKNKTNTVALPCYCPEGLVVPFTAHGWNVVFYPIFLDGMGPDASALNWDDFDVIVLVHFFGLMRDFVPLKRKAADHGVVVIEDFSHFLPAVFFETVPEAGVYELVSLPKLFGVPDGALLRGAGIDKLRAQLGPWDRRYVWPSVAMMRVDQQIRWVPAVLCRFIRRLVNALASPYKRLGRSLTSPRAMSPGSLSRFAAVSVDHTAQIRTKYWNAYAEGLPNSLTLPLHGNQSKPPSNVMFGFPVYVQDRDRFVSFMQAGGVSPYTAVSRWDFRHLQQSQQAREITATCLNHIAILPIQDHLTSRDIQTVIDRAVAWETRCNSW